MGGLSDLLIRRGVSLTVSRNVVITMQLMAASVVVAGYVGRADRGVAADPVGGVRVGLDVDPLGHLHGRGPPAAAGSLAGIMNTAGALAGSWRQW